jgi:SPP1 family predicted phage head-tail adaptor
MDFSKLRHRIIFLKPSKNVLNSMGETVPAYIPFKPGLKNILKMSDGSVYLTKDALGNAVLVMSDGKVYAHELALTEYSVAGGVWPMTGREYQEAQKIRAETTFKVATRYFAGITSDMRILFKNKELLIQSVLNVEERNRELQIICTEDDKKTAQDFSQG